MWPFKPNVQKMLAQRNVRGLIAASKRKQREIARAATVGLGHVGGPEAIAHLIGCLSEGDPRLEVAARALVRMGAPAVAPLGALLQDPYSCNTARVVAASALGQIGNDEAVAYLGSQLTGSSIAVEAARALEEVGSAQAIDQIIGGLRLMGHHWEELVRILVRIGQPAVAPLRSALTHSDPWIQERAAKALARLDARLGPADQARCALLSGETVPPSIGMASLDVLEGKLYSGRFDEQKLAFQSLVAIAETGVVDPLCRMVANSKAPTRWRSSAARELARIGLPEGASREMRAWVSVAASDWEAVISLGEAALPPLRLLAESALAEPGMVECLSSLGGAADTDLFVRLLSHSSDKVSLAAIQALVRIGSPAVGPLSEYLTHPKDSSWNSRTACRAAAVLGQIGDPSAIPSLTKKACEEPGDRATVAAAAAQVRFGGTALNDLMGILASNAILRHRLTEGLSCCELSCGSEASIVAQVLRMALTTDGSAVEQLRQARPAAGILGGILAAKSDRLDSWQLDKIRSSAALALAWSDDEEAVELLAAVLHDPSDAVRRNSATAAGARKAVELTAALQSMLLTERSSSVRTAAAEALAQIGGCPAALAHAWLYSASYERRDAGAEALASADLEGLLALVQASYTDDKDMRLAAAKAFGLVGRGDAVPRLCELLSDPCAEIRQASANSLWMLGDKTASAALTQALQDDDKLVRFHAARALARAGYGSGAEILRSWVRAYDADTGGRAQDRETAKAALQSLADIDRESAIGECLRAYQKWGDTAYVWDELECGYHPMGRRPGGVDVLLRALSLLCSLRAHEVVDDLKSGLAGVKRLDVALAAVRSLRMLDASWSREQEEAYLGDRRRRSLAAAPLAAILREELSRKYAAFDSYGPHRYATSLIWPLALCGDRSQVSLLTRIRSNLRSLSFVNIPQDNAMGGCDKAIAYLEAVEAPSETGSELVNVLFDVRIGARLDHWKEALVAVDSFQWQGGSAALILHRADEHEAVRLIPFRNGEEVAYQYAVASQSGSVLRKEARTRRVVIQDDGRGLMMVDDVITDADI